MAGNGGASNSDAYNRLIKSRTDLVGAIAYALYKADKREFIISNQLTPDDPQVKNYHQRLGAESVEGLRLRAESLVSENTSKAVAEAEARGQAKFQTGIDDVKALLLKRTGFWTAVWASVVATLIFAAILSGAIVLNKNQQNPLGAIYELLHEGTSNAPASSASGVRR